MNLTRGDWFFGCGFTRQRALWIQRDHSEIVFRQIIRGDAFDVVERYLLDSVEIMAAKIQIASKQPVRADVRGLAAHCGERAEVVTKRDFLRLLEFLRGNAGLFHFINNPQGQLIGCVAFLWIDHRINPKQPWIARRVRERGYAERQTGFFPDAPVQARAAPVTENGREKIERGHVRIRDFRDVPCEREMRQFRGKLLVHFASAKLRRFRWNEYRLERFLRIRLKQFC